MTPARSNLPFLTPGAAKPERRVLLQGAVNCRDLGGYRTSDGRQIRWGQIYRSDSLAELTDVDLLKIQNLGLRRLLDLRHESERLARPNRLPAGSSMEMHSVGFFPHGAETLLRRVRGGEIVPREIHQDFIEMYRRLPIEQAASYARILDLLLEDRALPVLIHCTSGKDRTGFAAAVILMALDVPRTTIVEDYLLTNDYRRDLSFLLGGKVGPAVMAAVTQAHPAYVESAFRSIEFEWGTTTEFLRRGLGLSRDRQRQLQSLLLELPVD